MVICPCVCDYDHYHPEEEERLTTTVNTTGESAQGEGRHYDTMTGSTAMVTTMRDRLQERSDNKSPTTSLDYVIRLTDRLQSLRTKISDCFSHFGQKKWCISGPENLPKNSGQPIPKTRNTRPDIKRIFSRHFRELFQKHKKNTHT